LHRLAGGKPSYDFEETVSFLKASILNSFFQSGLRNSVQSGEGHSPLQGTSLATEGDTVIAAPVNHGGSIRQVTKKYAGRTHASRSPQYGSHIFGQPPKRFSSVFSCHGAP
jgi:hypothetical protein